MKQQVVKEGSVVDVSASLIRKRYLTIVEVVGKMARLLLVHDLGVLVRVFLVRSELVWLLAEMRYEDGVKCLAYLLDVISEGCADAVFCETVMREVEGYSDGEESTIRRLVRRGEMMSALEFAPGGCDDCDYAFSTWELRSCA